MAFFDHNSLGERGEKYLYLGLTSLKNRKQPLFHPSFLGEKFPTLDFLVVLTGKSKIRPFFFVQVKTTKSGVKKGKGFRIRGKDADGLLPYPAPTYLALVDEPTKRVYLKSVHGDPVRRTYMPSKRFLLTEPNLIRLRNEVRAYWRAQYQKPVISHFHDDAKW